MAERRVADTLSTFLADWLGLWPPPGGGLFVVGSDQRVQPSWDGSLREVVGVETLDGAVLSVPPSAVDTVRSLGGDLDTVGASLGEAVGHPTWRFGRGIFRWTAEPVAFDDPGVWLPTDDPRLPNWLRPFNGDVLVGVVDDAVVAGVGRKIHNPWGHEIAVVTEEGHRGQGWARRLVSQAAQRILNEGAVPIYLHAEDNLASARTAEACGFEDDGWRVLGLFPR